GRLRGELPGGNAGDADADGRALSLLDRSLLGVGRLHRHADEEPLGRRAVPPLTGSAPPADEDAVPASFTAGASSHSPRPPARDSASTTELTCLGEDGFLTTRGRMPALADRETPGTPCEAASRLNRE